MNLSEIIKDYFEKRGLKWSPNSWQSLAFLQTELAEVYELLLDRESGYVRNNPQNKPQFDKDKLEEELGDVIMMTMVTGIIEGVDPLQGLLKKMERKLKALNG